MCDECNTVGLILSQVEAHCKSITLYWFEEIVCYYRNIIGKR